MHSIEEYRAHVWSCSISTAAKVLWLALIQCAESQGTTSPYASSDTLERMCSSSTSTIRTKAKELADAGHVASVRMDRGKAYRLVAMPSPVEFTSQMRKFYASAPQNLRVRPVDFTDQSCGTVGATCAPDPYEKTSTKVEVVEEARESTPPSSQPTLPNPYLDTDDSHGGLDVLISETIEQAHGQAPSNAGALAIALLSMMRIELGKHGSDTSPADVARMWVGHQIGQRVSWAKRKGASANQLAALLTKQPDVGQFVAQLMAPAPAAPTYDHRPGMDARSQHMRQAAQDLLDRSGAHIARRTVVSSEYEEIDI